MASERTPIMSVDEYFELEENNPDTRYEYLDGYVYMAEAIYLPLGDQAREKTLSDLASSGTPA
jgi:hypothetical protein